jgi:hypothetical protein
VQQDSFVRIHLAGLLLLLAFVIAALIFWLFPPQHVARTLFFPGTTEMRLSGECRLVPRTSDQERAMELVVEELLLGPLLISHGRLFPRETAARALVLADGTAYVDLNTRAMLSDQAVRIPVADAIAAVRETLLFNFRSLEDVVVTIEGNVPFVPAYR